MTTPVSQPAPSSRWLDRFAAGIAHLVPDPITASVIMLIALVIAALSLGNSGPQVMDAYYRSLWMLLPFTMQMTLIIVLSSALASTPFFRGAVARLAEAPRNAYQFIGLAVLITGVAAYFYWGLGLALGPVIAVYFARAAERKGIPIDFPLYLSTMGAANSLWQFGLSSSAPLLMATEGHFLQKTTGVIPLTRTIWSPAAILHEVLFAVALMVTACLLMPKKGGRQISEFPESEKVADPVPAPPAASASVSEWLEKRPYFNYILCAVLAVWLWTHFGIKKLSLDINSLNTTLLLASLILHANFKSFTMALERSIVSAWPVIVLYHLYAGLAGLIQHTNVGETLAALAAQVTNPYTFPGLTAAISAVFSFFVPSSGGQWAIQGFVIAKSAEAVGITVERGLLAMSVGDHIGNLLSPFWVVILAGIARLDFRRFFGYGLIYALLWFVIGVVVFTFAPC